MSVSKPVKKHPKTEKNPAPSTLQLVPTELEQHSEEEGNGRLRRTVVISHVSPPISSTPPTRATPPLPMMTTTETTDESMSITPKDPHGHKVKILEDVWKAALEKDFLKISDTYVLTDLWIQPIELIEYKGAYASVNFLELISAPYFKFHFAKAKIWLEDLIRMLYLAARYTSSLHGNDLLPFDQWMQYKSKRCDEIFGPNLSKELGVLCKYVMYNDPDTNYYPSWLYGNWGIFFKKISYHRYEGENIMGLSEMENPSMIKCSSKTGVFEYVIQATLFPFPRDHYIFSLDPELSRFKPKTDSKNGEKASFSSSIFNPSEFDESDKE